MGPVPAPGAAGDAPLLVACALGIERLALRLGERGRTYPPLTVLKTGMGPAAAERALTDALAHPDLREAAVVATGFCAGLEPGTQPGDLVVATTTTRGAGDEVACTGTELLVKELRRLTPGRSVHTGTLLGTDHVVRGAERAELRASGAIAVDMESAATLHAARAAGRPVAAVRVVVDTPDHELVRISTLRGGITAFRVLRSVLPAFFEWHRNSLLPRR